MFKENFQVYLIVKSPELSFNTQHRSVWISTANDLGMDPAPVC